MFFCSGKINNNLTICSRFTALDFSPKMIATAKDKIKAENVTFTETDLTAEWPVKPGWANLITCSLVLEHIEDGFYFC